jgi:hypothetical protein
MPLLAPPVRDYDGRRTMRSLADALAKLREEGLADGEHAEIKTAGFDLPSCGKIGLVWVVGLRNGSMFFSVHMPSARMFSARTSQGERLTYPIHMLDGARSDAEGNVQLADGRFVHAVDLIPAPFFREFSATEHAIVRLAIKICKVEDKFFQPFDTEILPNLMRVRYEGISKASIKRFSLLRQRICEQMPGVSSSQVASALKRAGFRVKRGPRQQSAPQSRHLGTFQAVSLM